MSAFGHASFINLFTLSNFFCSKYASANLIFPMPPKGGLLLNQLITNDGDVFFKYIFFLQDTLFY